MAKILRNDVIPPPPNYGCPAEIRVVEAENGVALYINAKLFVFNSVDEALAELKNLLETKK